MTLAERFDSWAQQHEQKGLAKGIEKGIEKGKSELAIGLAINRLTKKFGIMPSEYREKINTLDLNSLEMLNYEIDDFTSLDDVRKYLAL